MEGYWDAVGRLEPLKRPPGLSQPVAAGYVLSSAHAEGICPPVLPQASTAQSTHVSYTFWGVPVPYSLGGGSAEPRGRRTPECLLGRHVPSLSWELLFGSCCLASSKKLLWSYRHLHKGKANRSNSSPRTANGPLLLFKACSQNPISQHDQLLCWNYLPSHLSSIKMYLLTNTTPKIHRTTQWKKITLHEEPGYRSYISIWITCNTRQPGEPVCRIKEII